MTLPSPVLLFLMFVSFLGTAFPQKNANDLILSLKKCEELALAHSEKIQDANLSVKISKAKKIQASHAGILPRFEVRNIWGPSPKAEGTLDPSGSFVIPKDVNTSIPGDLRYFTQLDLDIIQPIFTFGKLSGLSTAAGFAVRADEANLRKKKNETKFEIRKLYWGLLFGQEILSVIGDTRRELTKAENKIRALLDEGSEEVSQIDLFKLQIAEYDIDKRYREALNKIQLTKSAFRLLLGLPEKSNFDLDAEYLEPIQFVPDSLIFYTQMAAKNRPEIVQLNAGINARRALIGVSRSDYYPQFFLGGQVKYNFAKDRFDPKGQYIYNPTNYFRPGLVLGVNWNLNFVQTRDKIRLAQAEYNKLAEKEAVLTDGLRLEVEKAYLELTQAEANIRSGRKALRASENWLRSETMTWDIGVGEVKDLIDAFKANGMMQAAHLENIFKYNVALAALSKAVGRNLYPN